jgi:hypothetical protein
MCNTNFLSLKNILAMLILLFVCLSTNAWRYDDKKDVYYYTIDLSDYSGWHVINDNDDYDVLFQNKNRDAFIEVAVFDLNTESSNERLLETFTKRLKMDGGYARTKFCKYNAIKGEYSFYYNNTDLIMNIIVFKDNYYYYVVMGYAYNKKYNSYKDELERILYSFKVYYDDGVVYGNDSRTESSDKIKEDNTPKNKKNDDQNKEKSDIYTVHIKWDKSNKTFKFLKSDLDKCKKELDEIGKYTGNNWNGWKYYNIDLDEDDYEFKFWTNFYQDMFKKNYYRVNDVYNYFKNISDNLSSFELANQVIKCIQIIPYERPKNIESEKTGTGLLDYFTPNQLAYYDKGDCDTKSLFMIILLRRLGFDALLFYSKEYSHAMVGLNINATGNYKIYDGKKYYFIESTYPNWKIGDIPQGMDNLKKWRVVPIK